MGTGVNQAANARFIYYEILENVLTRLAMLYYRNDMLNS